MTVGEFTSFIAALMLITYVPVTGMGLVDLFYK